LRGRFISALTATKDPSIAKMLINRIFNKNTRDNEKVTYIFGLVRKKELKTTMFPWLDKNFDRVIKDLPTNMQGYAPTMFSTDCDEAAITRLNTVLKPKLPNLIGADRNFTKVEDYMKQCFAKKAHIKPQITALVSSK